MKASKSFKRPTICYRPIQPSDLDRLQQIHSDIFPIRYESEFFQNVVNGCEIVSWAAVDQNRPDDHSENLIGFVTARIVLARESEIADIMRCKSEEILVYILTLGVVQEYRNLGIATSLIDEVIKYASNLPTCRGVYLHVLSQNKHAISLYHRMSFKCVRRLHRFYLINGQHYDAFLFVFFIHGGRPPCSPLEILITLMGCMRNGIKLVAAKLTRNDEKGFKRLRCKDTRCLLPTQNRRNHTAERNGCDCV